jgi:L-2,4-diaminobutyrate decarboxylase
MNWLGIGESNTIIMPADIDRTTKLDEAERLIRKEIEQGYIIPAIILNGGTTYDNAIDDIGRFRQMRDKLVREYNLTYIPHIHVDSVIGWSFLMFRDYDFDTNELGIDKNTLQKLKIQSQKASGIALADSWGVDFHKGIGSCPIPCSLIVVNEKEGFATLLQQNENGDNLHQLAQEFSHTSPVDYTLETSRSGGAALAGLTALLTLGRKGFQSHLANLVQVATVTRKIADNDQSFNVVNKASLGFVTMLQLIPPLTNISAISNQMVDPSPMMADLINFNNKYNEEFYKFDKENRIEKGKSVEYSFSKGYRNSQSGAKISAIKLYPTSPLITPNHAIETIKLLKERKRIFDKINKFDKLVL